MVVWSEIQREVGAAGASCVKRAPRANEGPERSPIGADVCVTSPAGVDERELRGSSITRTGGLMSFIIRRVRRLLNILYTIYTILLRWEHNILFEIGFVLLTSLEHFLETTLGLFF